MKQVIQLFLVLPHLQTEIEKRLCQVTAKHRNHTVCLTISFPITYPRQHTPVFKFSYGTTIDYACKADLLKVGTVCPFMRG